MPLLHPHPIPPILRNIRTESSGAYVVDFVEGSGGVVGDAGVAVVHAVFLVELVCSKERCWR